MRSLLILASALFIFGIPATAGAQDSVKPTVVITKSVKKSKGNRTLLDFFLKASDDVQVRYVFVRGKVDGKQGPWRRYDYFEIPGERYHLPFLVDCHTFTFEVYSQDASGNKSAPKRKTFNGLR